MKDIRFVFPTKTKTNKYNKDFSIVNHWKQIKNPSIKIPNFLILKWLIVCLGRWEGPFSMIWTTRGCTNKSILWNLRKSSKLAKGDHMPMAIQNWMVSRHFPANASRSLRMFQFLSTQDYGISVSLCRVKVRGEEREKKLQSLLFFFTLNFRNIKVFTFSRVRAADVLKTPLIY